MNILLGALYYEPAWAYAGVPKLVYDLARALVRRGHEVTVCTTDVLDERERITVLEEVSHGVRIVRFRNVSNRLAYHLKIFIPTRMRRWLAANVACFEVVHLFDARTLLNAWAARAALRSGTPFVLSVLGELPRGTGWQSWVKRVYDRRHGPVVIGRASALLAQNEHEAQVYQEYGGDPRRIVLWPLAVDPDDHARLPERGAFRARFGIGPEEPVVLFVGRIHELKGLDPLLRAFARARERVPAARLVVIGRDDGFLRAVQALARELDLDERLLLPGALYGADVLPAYVDCDLFAITPTHFEETSLASLAACACSRPVLINDRCRIPWLEEYDAGRCVSHSVENVAAALAELLADRSALERMGRNARRMIEERFLWPRVVEQVEDVYRRAIARKAG